LRFQSEEATWPKTAHFVADAEVARVVSDRVDHAGGLAA
jgi:hypothetical protein